MHAAGQLQARKLLGLFPRDRDLFLRGGVLTQGLLKRAHVWGLLLGMSRRLLVRDLRRVQEGRLLLVGRVLPFRLGREGTPCRWHGVLHLPLWLALRALPVWGLLSGARVGVTSRRRGVVGGARAPGRRVLRCEERFPAGYSRCLQWASGSCVTWLALVRVCARLGCHPCNRFQVSDLAVNPLREQVEGNGVTLHAYADNPRRGPPLGLFLSWVSTRHLDCIDKTTEVMPRTQVPPRVGVAVV